MKFLFNFLVFGLVGCASTTAFQPDYSPFKSTRSMASSRGVSELPQAFQNTESFAAQHRPAECPTNFNEYFSASQDSTVGSRVSFLKPITKGTANTSNIFHLWNIRLLKTLSRLDTMSNFFLRAEMSGQRRTRSANTDLFNPVSFDSIGICNAGKAYILVLSDSGRPAGAISLRPESDRLEVEETWVAGQAISAAPFYNLAFNTKLGAHSTYSLYRTKEIVKQKEKPLELVPLAEDLKLQNIQDRIAVRFESNLMWEYLPESRFKKGRICFIDQRQVSCMNLRENDVACALEANERNHNDREPIMMGYVARSRYGGSGEISFSTTLDLPAEKPLATIKCGKIAFSSLHRDWSQIDKMKFHAALDMTLNEVKKIIGETISIWAVDP